MNVIISQQIQENASNEQISKSNRIREKSGERDEANKKQKAKIAETQSFVGDETI